MSTKNILLTVLAISHVLFMLLVILYIGDGLTNTLESINTSIIAEEALRRDRFKRGSAPSITEPVKEKVFVADVPLRITRGETFFLDKGELKLTAKAKLNKKNQLYVNGKEFHVGGQLVDGTIDEPFYYDPFEKRYTNKSQTIFITGYNGHQFTVEDKRTNVCLPFNGTLVLKD